MASRGQQLLPGSLVRGYHSGLIYRVEELLGSGGQGEVYRVLEGGQAWALKWYYPEWMSREQLSSLERLVAKGPPDERFLWPLELVGKPEPMGYIMPLREARFRGLNDLVAYRIRTTFNFLSIAGRDLADSFLRLHSRGLCYRDISFGNVFFEPSSGEVLICDNDNVGIDGSEASVRGTPKFMAPEIICNDSSPNARTDLYSLSVLMFYMFMRSHPLEGQRERDIRFYADHIQTDLLDLYGRNPVFIFDPQNDSNRPAEDQANSRTFWALYPRFFRDLFIRAFTVGLQDPYSRVYEGEWRSNLIQLRDLIRYCPACGAESFFDPKEEGSSTCWNCSRPLPQPWRLELGLRIVVLNRDTQLCPYHLGDVTDLDFSTSAACVVQHPQNPNRYGIRNLSRRRWEVLSANGDSQPVPPGATVSIRPGVRIDFGQVQGEIKL